MRSATDILRSRRRERVGRAGDCASATNNSFLVALRLRFMNERRTGTRHPPSPSPSSASLPLSPARLQPLASLSPTDPRLRHLFLSLSLFPLRFSRLFSPALSIAQRSRTRSVVVDSL